MHVSEVVERGKCSIIMLKKETSTKCNSLCMDMMVQFTDMDLCNEIILFTKGYTYIYIQFT